MAATAVQPRTKALSELLQDNEDFEHEEEIIRNPYSVKVWKRYLDAKKGAKHHVRYLIYERALKFLPGSYKLWKAYLDERRIQARKRCINDRKFVILCNCYERSLVNLHKMPRIWLDYCGVLITMKKATATRRTFDRALQSLPVTQHARIWELCLEFVKDLGVWETTVKVYRRFLQFDGGSREEYVDYLMSIHHYEEAGQQLALIVNDDSFQSKKGKTKHQLWMDLCRLIAKYPEQVAPELNVEAIVRSGIRRFTDEVGRLWCTLADYYIRLGQFERARDVYEEGISSVVTVRDFSMIFDAYSQFEESMLSVKMELLDEKEAEKAETGEKKGPKRGKDNGNGKEGDKEEQEEDEDEEHDGAEADDVELRLARLEYLMDRRPLLLSSVLLRQNPHNVNEWRKRIKLFADDPTKVILTFTEAVKTIDPQKAVGKFHNLWVAFAKYYEEHEDLENARVIFEKAVQVNFKTVDDLASVWCEWAEMELRHDNFDEALATIERATEAPASSLYLAKQMAGGGGKGDRGAVEKREWNALPVQARTYRSHKVWSLYLDLAESLGSVSVARSAYERCLSLKVCSVQMLLNYASFLEENKFFEESFRVFEKGLSLFSWPHLHELWLAYLTKFVQRYQGKKLERARDLFEQVVASAPPERAKVFFLLYAKLEEQHGLLRHAMRIYDRATRAVQPADQREVFEVYLRKVEEFFGAVRTREVFEKALEALQSDQDVLRMCLRFAEMERKLGEIDRARAIFVHGAQMANPARTGAAPAAPGGAAGGDQSGRDRKSTPPQAAETVIDEVYWRKWQEFEIAHGNEDTFREMLRVKRSVAAYFSQVNFTAADMLQAAQAKEKPVSDADAMKKLEKEQQQQQAQEEGGVVGLERRKAADGDEEAELRRLRNAVAGGGAGDGRDAEREQMRATAKAFAQKVRENGSDRVAGASTANPEELDIDLDDDEDEEEAAEGETESRSKAGEEDSGVETVTEKAVPKAVFGSATEEDIKKARARKASEDLEAGEDAGGNAGGATTGTEKQGLGALARFKKRKVA